MTGKGSGEVCETDPEVSNWEVEPTLDVVGDLGLVPRAAPLTLMGPSVDGPASWLVFNRAQDWASHIGALNIHPLIPAIVQAKFSRARRLYLLGWIDADVIKAGELAALVALELTLKDRLWPKLARKDRSLAGALRHLVEIDGLTDAQIPVIARHGGTAVGFLTGDNKPSLADRRNSMAHGDPFDSLPVGGLLELVRDLIDFAYRDYLAEIGASETP